MRRRVCSTSVSRSRFLFFRRFLSVHDWRVLSRGSIFLFQGECTQYSKHPLSCFTLRWADRHKSLRWWAERGVKDKLFVLRQWWKGAPAKQRKDYISRSTARWAAVYFKKSTEAQVSGAVHDKTLKSALQNVNIFRRWSDSKTTKAANVWVRAPKVIQARREQIGQLGIRKQWDKCS